MMAALQAAESSDILLLEKNQTLGKKLLLTGGGRCNLTSAIDEALFLDKIHTEHFFRPAWRAFSAQDLIAFFEDRGLSFKKEALKYYPVTDSASSVLEVLIEALHQRGVHIHTKAQVRELELSPGRFRVITTDKAYTSERLILACGGASYPATGSDGALFEILKQKGIQVTVLEAGLCGLYGHDRLNSLSGISLPDVELSYGKRKFRGELLFTHHGISGPMVLDLSSQLSHFPLELKLDFLPDHSETDLLERFFLPDKSAPSTLLARFLPKRVAQLLMQEFDKEDRFNFNKLKRRALLDTIKHYRMRIDHKGDLGQAMVTVGGVDLAELIPATLEHRRIQGLYMVGEMLDLHGPSGGYNLQIAFSTGYLAGRSIGADATASPMSVET